MAGVSNTQSTHLSVQWIDAAKAAHFHVSLKAAQSVTFDLLILELMFLFSRTQ